MKIEMRTAAIRDMLPVLELSNDPDVRTVSFSTGRIKPDVHERWYREKLADEDCVFLVFYDGETLAGQIRFQISGGEGTNSISAGREYRGRGFGRTMLEQALAYLQKKRPDVGIVKAMVKTENTASMRFFGNFGFVREPAVTTDQNAVFTYKVN